MPTSRRREPVALALGARVSSSSDASVAQGRPLLKSGDAVIEFDGHRMANRDAILEYLFGLPDVNAALPTRLMRGGQEIRTLVAPSELLVFETRGNAPPTASFLAGPLDGPRSLC